MSDDRNKPSRTYGHIALSKDGRVKKNLFGLSLDKNELELQVIQHFAGELFPATNSAILRLHERDNDFKLTRSNEEDITVELTEVTRQHYMRKMSREEYDRGEFDAAVHEGIDKIWKVERALRDQVLIKRIDKKLKYQKPAGRFWLVIWTAESEYTHRWGQGGAFHEDRSVVLAREHIASNLGNFPYDEVWVTSLQLRPYRVWPPSV